MDNSDLLFRKAEEADIARIWEIIGQAKAQMRRLNSHQWDENYPALKTLPKIFNRETDMSFVIKKI